MIIHHHISMQNMVLVIETGEVLAGQLPPRVLGLVQEWRELHKTEWPFSKKLLVIPKLLVSLRLTHDPQGADMNKPDQIKALFDSLSPQEKGRLLKELQVAYTAGLQSNKQSQLTTCPHCQSAYIIKYGHWKQTQRYKCHTCQRTFNGATGSSRYHVKKPRQFEAYKRLMTTQYYPLHEIAKKVGVSMQTVFDWRHKI